MTWTPHAILWLLVLTPTTASFAGPGETSTLDVLQIVLVDRELLAIDGESGHELGLRLELHEKVILQRTRGRVGVVVTDRRMLAVAVSSGSWQRLRFRHGERLLEEPLLGERVALLLTNRRAIGFDGGSRNLVESDLGPGEKPLARAVGANVAIVATKRRALGLSPFRGGFFETSLRLQEELEDAVATGNLATLTTSRRLLTFKAGSGSWSERNRGLGF
ncbi:MAG: hypothetical protein GY937_00505 [bacterium]|nr:hypothetical protein [bacterium]